MTTRVRAPARVLDSLALAETHTHTHPPPIAPPTGANLQELCTPQRFKPLLVQHTAGHAHSLRLQAQKEVLEARARGMASGERLNIEARVEDEIYKEETEETSNRRHIFLCAAALQPSREREAPLQERKTQERLRASI